MSRPNLGPAVEASRNRQLIQAQTTAARKPAMAQDDPATLALFASVLERRLI